MRDVVSFYREDVAQVREHAHNDFCGPCPLCGGADRFHCSGTRWGCRQCGASGDSVGYLAKVRGLSWSESYRLAGEHAHSERGQYRKSDVQGPKEPSEQWAQQAAKLVKWAQGELSLPAGLAILEARHISYQTAVSAGVGFVPKAQYLRREEWGLEPRDGRDYLFVPSGLLLPVRRRSGVKSLQVRCYPPLRSRDGRETRHLKVEGSGTGFSYILGTGTEGACIFESILDAVLAYQASEGLLTVIATGSASVDVDPQTASFLQGCKYVFGCPDRDEAGRSAWQRWKEAFPEILLAHSFFSKDLGELVDKEGEQGLKRWLTEKILAPITASPIDESTDQEEMSETCVCQSCKFWEPIESGIRGLCSRKGQETSAIARCVQVA